MLTNKVTNDRYQNLLKITAINMFFLPVVFDFKKLPKFSYFILPYLLLVIAGCYSLKKIIIINKKLKNNFPVVTPDDLRNLDISEKEKYFGVAIYIAASVVIFAFGLIHIL